MLKKLKINLTGEENIDLCVDGIKQDNTYKYLENGLIVLITCFNNKITIKRSNADYQVTLNFEHNKKTVSTYEFSGGNKVFNLETYTKELVISDNKLLVKYNLEGNDFEFKLEVVQ